MDLTGQDHALAHVVPPFSQTAPTPLAMGIATRTRNEARGTEGFDTAEAALRRLNELLQTRRAQNLTAEIQRIARSDEAP